MTGVDIRLAAMENKISQLYDAVDRALPGEIRMRCLVLAIKSTKHGQPESKRVVEIAAGFEEFVKG